MKATKILAGLSAAAFAASMISMVSVYADDIGAAGSKSITTTEESKYGGEDYLEPLTMKELLGGANGVAPEDVVAVKFYSDNDKEFTVLYNGKTVTSHDPATGKDGYLNNTLGKNTSFRIEDINFTDFYVALEYAPGIADDTIDINWEVLIESEVTDSTPDDSSEVNNKVEVNRSVSYNSSFGFSSTSVPADVTEYNQAVMTFSGLDVDPAAKWNNECSFVIEITNAEGLTQYCAVGGTAVGETIKYKGNDLKVIKTDESGNITVAVPFASGSTITVKGLSWSDAPDSPYFQVDSIVFNNEGEVTPSTPDESSSKPESSSSKPSSSSSKPASSSSSKYQSDASNGSGSSSSQASSSSSTASSSSKAAGTAAATTTSGSGTAAATDTSNPTTGAAALGALGVLLAGAAMVVSKKND